MKISAESGALAKALSTVTRAASKKGSVAVLSAVLVQAEGETLTLSATDVELSISLRSEAKIEEQGTAAIPARMLFEIVSKLGNVAINLETDDKGATLSTSTSSYTLRTYEPSEFPAVPAFDSGAAFSMSSAELAEAISRASAAVSTDETRPVLCGLLTSFSGGKLEMASTDSYRLSLYRSTIEGGPAEEKGAVIPARALSEVSRLCQTDETVEVMLTENAAMFRINGAVIRTRLIDGNFPDYGRLLPEEFAKEFEVPAGQLRDTLKRVNLFSGATAGKSAKGGSPGAPVRFAFAAAEGSLSGGTLTVSSSSADTGGAIETLEASVPDGLDGGQFVMAFNGNYLADGVSEVIASGSDTVRLRANEELKPAVLSPAEKEAGSETGDSTDREYLYLIMPMRDPGAEATGASKERATGKDDVQNAPDGSGPDNTGSTDTDTGEESQVEPEDDGPHEDEPAASPVSAAAAG